LKSESRFSGISGWKTYNSHRTLKKEGKYDLVRSHEDSLGNAGQKGSNQFNGEYVVSGRRNI